jgi:osmotically-inducible protein OsmY
MQTRSDDLIRSDVLFELKWDPKIGSSGDIAVAVKEGVVTLSGFTHSYWDKDAAEQAAKRVYGVRGVANDIEVKPSSSEPIRRSHEMPFKNWSVMLVYPATKSKRL